MTLKEVKASLANSSFLQAAVILNDILPSLKSMGHWLEDTHIQQVRYTGIFCNKTIKSA